MNFDLTRDLTGGTVLLIKFFLVTCLCAGFAAWSGSFQVTYLLAPLMSLFLLVTMYLYMVWTIRSNDRRLPWTDAAFRFFVENESPFQLQVERLQMEIEEEGRRLEAEKQQQEAERQAARLRKLREDQQREDAWVRIVKMLSPPFMADQLRKLVQAIDPEQTLPVLVVQDIERRVQAARSLLLAANKVNTELGTQAVERALRGDDLEPIRNAFRAHEHAQYLLREATSLGVENEVHSLLNSGNVSGAESHIAAAKALRSRQNTIEQLAEEVEALDAYRIADGRLLLEKLRASVDQARLFRKRAYLLRKYLNS